MTAGCQRALPAPLADGLHRARALIGLPLPGWRGLLAGQGGLAWILSPEARRPISELGRWRPAPRAGAARLGAGSIPSRQILISAPFAVATGRPPWTCRSGRLWLLLARELYGLRLAAPARGNAGPASSARARPER